MKMLGIMTDSEEALKSAYVMCTYLFPEFEVVEGSVTEEEADHINLHDGLIVKVCPSNKDFNDVDSTIQEYKDEEELYYLLEAFRKAYEEGELV